MTRNNVFVFRIARRRRLGVLLCVGGIVALLVIGAGLAAASPTPYVAGNPTRPVDTDINKYVLLAIQQLSLKGAESPGFGNISGGDIGVYDPWVKAVDPQWSANGVEMNVCANGSLQMDQGSQVVADSMRGSNLCSFWDVYANSSVGSPPMLPQNSGPNPFTPPAMTLPPFPSFACNPANSVTVPKHGNLTLPPGVYGDVSVQDGASLQLQDGSYTFCNFNTGQTATVNNTAADTFFVAGNFTLSPNGTTFGPFVDLVYVQGSVNFSSGATVSSKFYAPNGAINLGHGSQLFGKFWGLTINSDWNININYNPPGSTTTGSSSSTSTSTSTTSTSSTSSSPSSTSTSSTSTSTSSSTSTTTTTEETTFTF